MGGQSQREESGGGKRLGKNESTLHVSANVWVMQRQISGEYHRANPSQKNDSKPRKNKKKKVENSMGKGSSENRGHHLADGIQTKKTPQKKKPPHEDTWRSNQEGTRDRKKRNCNEDGDFRIVSDSFFGHRKEGSRENVPQSGPEANAPCARQGALPN